MNNGMAGMSSGFMAPMGMSGMYPSMGMQPTPMQPMNTGMRFNSGINNPGNFVANPGQINRVSSLPSNSGFANQPRPANQAFTLPHAKSNNSSIFSSNNSGAVKPIPPSSTNALDSLAMDTLSGFSKGSPAPTPASTSQLGNISAPNRMRYTQMFKATDNEKTGFLAGTI